MTRVKKTRSMKRIHSIKTGSKSKLKKQLGTDRQGRKDHQGKRTLSAYEKFLQANPEAAAEARQQQIQQQQQAEARKESDQPYSSKDSSKPDSKAQPERKKDLLEQLDEKQLKDVF